MDSGFQSENRVIKISKPAEFAQFKPDWERLYSSDKNSHHYVSWDWLNILFTVSSVRWFVLAVQNIKSRRFIAFFQFSCEDKKYLKIVPRHLIRLGSFPLGNYCGILCEEEFVKPAMEMVANYVNSHIKWDNLLITNGIDPKIELFLSCFSESGNKVEKNNLAVSTRIELPATWELYLKETLGKQSRKTFVRLLNRLAENKNAKIVGVNKKTLAHDLDILFELWQNKWGPQPNVEVRKKMLTSIFSLGKLQLNILWEKQHPIAAQCLILDPVNKTVYAHITGFDPNYPKLSPGNMIGLYSLKEAISNGYRYYEFYEGDDSYKLSFGAMRRHPLSAKVTNKKLKTSLMEKMLDLKKKLK